MRHVNPYLKNPYPAIGLKRTYGYLMKIREVFSQRDTLERKELLSAFGFSESNSSGHTALGALAHFGLVFRETAGGTTLYRVTDEAKILLAAEGKPDEWRILARKTATRPVLFRFLASEYSEALPVGLEARLVRKYPEVNSRNVGAIIHRYKESLKFAEGGAQPEGEYGEGRVESSGDIHHSTHDPMDFPFPLSNGVSTSLSLPSSLTKQEAERLVRYVQALAGTVLLEEDSK